MYTTGPFIKKELGSCPDFSKAMRSWIAIYTSILIYVLSCLAQVETRYPNMVILFTK